MSTDCYIGNWMPRDGQLYANRNKRNRIRSRGRIGGWMGLVVSLWRVRRNSYDYISGEIPKSGGISSTSSMRGTNVSFVAPEYGGGFDVSENCDVYSYGVLLLFLITGRSPLQVIVSLMSGFQQANLLSWVHHLTCAKKPLDLVDRNIQSLNKEQALLCYCITVALLCLQKSPVRWPSMKKKVLGMLC
ncbi:Receptor-like serine/threonine-protein kinase [Abeliophyllum distichum]|uniref:Receptor-like serine/threonine-protein kinase n=1 Tax=Abeliophyllum distichum TaxID=126358 RepID=A0ABD1Q7J6_9LAMI